MNVKRLFCLAVVVLAATACSLPLLSRPTVAIPSPVPWTPTAETVPATPTAAATDTPVLAPTQTPTDTPAPPSTPAPTNTSAPTPTQAPTNTPPAAATPVPVVPPSGARGPGFAAYAEIPVSLPAAHEGYALPVDLGAVGELERHALSGPQSTLLAQNGFVVAPADWIEFYRLYEQVRYQDLPVFVSTDSVYHIYHLIFDKMLRDLEREHFEPDIRALTSACLETAEDLYIELRGTALESAARSVMAYLSVADALIDPNAVAPPEVADLVSAELALIEAHEGVAGSPIFSQGCPEGCDPCDPFPPPACVEAPCMCEDYSQYVPRGHYTRSEQLQRYFRTMMWYGRINMRLAKPEETRMALLITHILRSTTVPPSGDPAAEVWGRIYDPTVFIVGKADDLGFHEYGALWDVVYGADAPASVLADEARLTAFSEAARQLPPPQINSMWVYIWEDKEQATQGFRFMGQRFVLDAYLIDELT